VRGFLEVSLGDLPAAHEHLGPLAEGVAASGVHEPGVLRWFGDAVEAFLAVDHIDRAEALIAAVERRAEDLDRRWVRGVAARSTGLLQAAVGQMDASESTLSNAALEMEPLGQPFELGRTLLALGSVRRRLKQRRGAREALERALEIFERIGTPLWADQAREGLSRIAGRAPAPLALTPTERRGALAVADGATNEEVARTLFMSPKTVEWNLSRIYRKVGVRSRTELARWLRAQG
jgi:DNA-binding CsgD family transcriptional regulator